VTFWIDDVKVATHSVAVVQKMKPGALDSVVGDGALVIDYMRMSAYASSGSYTSAVFDAGKVAAWVSAKWTATTPAGTTAVISYRTGNTPTPDATWTAFTSVPTSGAPLAGTSRYLQFTIAETTTVPSQTPVVSDVTIVYR